MLQVLLGYCKTEVLEKQFHAHRKRHPDAPETEAIRSCLKNCVPAGEVPFMLTAQTAQHLH